MSDPTQLEQFPCFYTFKIFGRSTGTFVERVGEIIAALLGTVPLDSMKVCESARGRYLSITIVTQVHSRAELERAYTDLRAEEQVLLYI